ncbi:MAG: type II CAAX endopeptidase family protein, partial [Byssovorax sp.]
LGSPQVGPDFTARGSRDRMPPAMRERWKRNGKREAATQIAVAYALLAMVVTAIALALREGVPWVHPEPWLAAPLAVSLSLSATLGLAVAAFLIVMTRLTVPRFAWARRLHEELRPVARDFTAGQILLIAGLSSLGEELLFRGLLTPWIGVVPAAILFGLAHQIKGPSRWIWAAWATVVGLSLGAIFALTGSLVGPLLAHAVVNGVNLVYLRDHDPGAAPPRAA